jgi:hypothetical protein
MRVPEKTSTFRLIDDVSATVGVKRGSDIRNRLGLLENIDDPWDERRETRRLD